ncbi:MAG TPA: hydrogenase maturation protease [Burkholderiales bacterium]|nr:hydrogenase maturation protease [Burkholderiales bacterium]
MTALAILGLGSPFGDDRAGWAAAQACMTADWLRASHGAVRVECLDRPGLDLLERMAGAHRVVLVDAMRSGATPGTVRRLGPEDLGRTALSSTHGFGVGDALALGRELGRLPAEIVLYGIEAERDHGEDLSPPVAAAITRVVWEIGAWVAGKD